MHFTYLPENAHSLSSSIAFIIFFKKNIIQLERWKFYFLENSCWSSHKGVTKIISEFIVISSIETGREDDIF